MGVADLKEGGRLIAWIENIPDKEIKIGMPIKVIPRIFEEIAEMSKEHGREMYEKDDEEHIKRMEEMTELMNDPEAMKDWMEKKKKEFDELPDEN